MAVSDLAELRKQCMSSLFLCTENVSKYLDSGTEKDEELGKLKSYEQEYCLQLTQENVTIEALEKTKGETDPSNVETFEDRFNAHLKKLGGSCLNIDNYLCTTEPNELVEGGWQSDSENLDESDVAITESQDHHIDPIIMRPIVEPVNNTVCGHVYERESIMKLIKMKHTTKCPVAGCGNRGPIMPQDLISDEELKFRKTITQHSTMIQEATKAAKAAVTRHLAATLDAQIRSTSCAATSLDALVPSTSRAAPSLDLEVLSTSRATASLDAQVPSTSRVAASLDAQVPSTSRAAASLNALVPSTSRAAPSLDLEVPSTSRVAASLDAQVPSTSRAAPSLDLEVLSTSRAAASLDAQVPLTYRAAASLVPKVPSTSLAAEFLDAQVPSTSWAVASLDAQVPSTSWAAEPLYAQVTSTYWDDASLDAQAPSTSWEAASLDAQIPKPRSHTLPTISADAPLEVSPTDIEQDKILYLQAISEQLVKQTWDLVPHPRKQKKGKNPQQAEVDTQARIQARLDEGHPGALSLTQVVSSTSQAEQVREQLDLCRRPEAMLVTSVGNQPQRRSKPSGKQAGRQVAKARHLTTAADPNMPRSNAKRSDTTTLTGCSNRVNPGTSQQMVADGERQFHPGALSVTQEVSSTSRVGQVLAHLDLSNWPEATLMTSSDNQPQRRSYPIAQNTTTPTGCSKRVNPGTRQRKVADGGRQLHPGALSLTQVNPSTSQFELVRTHLDLSSRPEATLMTSVYNQPQRRSYPIAQDTITATGYSKRVKQGTSQRKVADGGRQFHPGALSVAEVLPTTSQFEQVQALSGWPDASVDSQTQRRFMPSALDTTTPTGCSKRVNPGTSQRMPADGGRQLHPGALSLTQVNPSTSQFEQVRALSGCPDASVDSQTQRRFMPSALDTTTPTGCSKRVNPGTNQRMVADGGRQLHPGALSLTQVNPSTSQFEQVRAFSGRPKASVDSQTQRRFMPNALDTTTPTGSSKSVNPGTSQRMISDGGRQFQPGALSLNGVVPSTSQFEQVRALSGWPDPNVDSQPQRRFMPSAQYTTTPTSRCNRVRPVTSQHNGLTSYAVSSRHNELCVAIMSEPYHDLTVEQATVIRNTLELKFEDELLEPSTTSQTAKVHFHDRAHFSGGVLKLCCEDVYSLVWLRRAVNDIASPIAGTQLVVRSQAEEQRTITCGLFIPDQNREIYKLLRLLALHNPTININSWSLVKAVRQIERNTPGIYLVLRVPESDVDRIKQQEQYLYWLFGKIYVRILEGESKNFNGMGNGLTYPGFQPPQTTQNHGTYHGMYQASQVSTWQPACQQQQNTMDAVVDLTSEICLVDPPSTSNSYKDCSLVVERSEVSNASTPRRSDNFTQISTLQTYLQHSLVETTSLRRILEEDT